MTCTNGKKIVYKPTPWQSDNNCAYYPLLNAQTYQQVASANICDNPACTFSIFQCCMTRIWNCGGSLGFSNQEFDFEVWKIDDLSENNMGKRNEF